MSPGSVTLIRCAREAASGRGASAAAARRCGAFTVVELLVVIAIGAALVGLLIPTLSAARAAGAAGACASNIRQLITANHHFANEHEGRLAPGAIDIRSNLHRWHGSRATVHEPFRPRGGSLSPFLGPDGAVRRCPAFEPNGNDAAAFEAGAGGYGYNNAYLGVESPANDRTGARLSSVANPTLTVAFADAAFLLPSPSPRLIEYSFSEPPRRRDHPESPLDPSIHFRHRRETTIAWLDGHVSRRRLDHTRGNIFGASAEAMADAGIGWFGPDDNGLFDLE